MPALATQQFQSVATRLIVNDRLNWCPVWSRLVNLTSRRARQLMNMDSSDNVLRAMQPDTSLMMEKAVLEEPNRPAREFPLGTEGVHLIGRGADLEIPVMGDTDVSSPHALLRYDLLSAQWIFRDLGSAKGSFCNGRQVRETIVRAGDVVALGGKTRLQLKGSRAAVTSGDQVGFCSQAAVNLRAAVAKAARRSRPVVLIGPSGAGKSWLAKQIHRASREHPQLSKVTGDFVPFNCAQLADDSVHVADRLLGHQKGSFTDAIKDKTGLLEAAAGGTLFLDEVEKLSKRAQEFLLDIVDGGGHITRAGELGEEVCEVPRFRVIYASQRPLDETNLHHDLVNRMLNGLEIILPPLRDRAEDIPAFAAQLAAEFETGGRALHLTEEALRALREYHWPGQLRDLKAVLESLFEDAQDRASCGPPGAPLLIGEQHVTERLMHRKRARGHVAAPSTPPVAPPARKSARSLTREDVEAALRDHDNNREHARLALGVARETLYAKMRKFGIVSPLNAPKELR